MIKNLMQIHRPPLKKQSHCETHGEYTAQCHFGKIWTGCKHCSENRSREEAEALKKQEMQEALAMWKKRLGWAGIPDRFHEKTIAGFETTNEGQTYARQFAIDYCKSIEESIKNGRGALFIGKPGTGKTHLACAIGLHAMKSIDARVLFITVLRAVRSIKDTYSRGSDRTESEAVAGLVEPELLILDEVGVQTGSDFEKNILFDVINERYEKRKPTFFLSNLDVDSLAAYLGERVIDRLREDGGRVVAFDWESHRGKLSL